MSKADLAQAELELSYTTVRSPIDGYISERYADIGTLVGPGGKSQLATIVESDEVLVDFSLTALDYLRSQQRNVTLGEKDANPVMATQRDHHPGRQLGLPPDRNRGLRRPAGKSPNGYIRAYVPNSPIPTGNYCRDNSLK